MRSSHLKLCETNVPGHTIVHHNVADLLTEPARKSIFEAKVVGSLQSCRIRPRVLSTALSEKVLWILGDIGWVYARSIVR